MGEQITIDLEMRAAADGRQQNLHSMARVDIAFEHTNEIPQGTIFDDHAVTGPECVADRDDTVIADSRSQQGNHVVVDRNGIATELDDRMDASSELNFVQELGSGEARKEVLGEKRLDPIGGRPTRPEASAPQLRRKRRHAPRAEIPIGAIFLAWLRVNGVPAGT